jgi:hypothetical protein
MWEEPFEPMLWPRTPLGTFRSHGTSSRVIAIARWILLAMLTSAPAWALWLVFLAGPLLTAGLNPLAPQSLAAQERTFAWAHPAALAGVVLALVPLSRGKEFLARVPPRTRWGGELLALALGATYLQLPIAVARCATGAARADLTSTVPAILTLDLRLAAAALLLLVPPLSTTLRVALFLAAVWVVPALAAGAPLTARATAWLDAGVGLDAARLPAALVVAAALLLPGYLLRTRSAPASTR